MQHSCSVQLGCQAWCSKDACTVQRFRYMQHECLCCPACLLYAYMKACALLCTPGVGNAHTYIHTYIHTHVTANQVPALYVLSAYNVIAGVDPDLSIQATKTFLSRLAINLTYVHHCTQLYLTRCNTVDSRYCRAQLSALYREVPLIQR